MMGIALPNESRDQFKGAADLRHVGTLEPLWNLFDLTPEGRPSDRAEQLSYDRAPA